jgi:16S rRNA (guanine1516-N2)-methyltransferase
MESPRFNTKKLKILILFILIQCTLSQAKNALRSGDISTISHILDLESINDDGDAIFFSIKDSNFKKIILKRPIKADIIDKNINYQVKGKSTRFDIYI